MASFTHMVQINQGGMLSYMTDLDVVSNNLANYNTNGFKTSRSNFNELLSGFSLSGVSTRSTQMDITQGPMQATENPLDLSISGSGFFGVKLKGNQVAYTRDGQFRVDGANNLTTLDGYKVVWQGTIPADTEVLQVGQDGTVQAQVGGVWQVAGQIPLFNFTNPQGLLTNGSNQLLESPVSGKATKGVAGATGFGVVMSQSLEGSNVNMAAEMTRMISIQRGFDLALKTLQQTDQMMGEAIRMHQG